MTGLLDYIADALDYIHESVRAALDVLHIDIDKMLVALIAVGWATSIALAFVSLYYFALAVS